MVIDSLEYRVAVVEKELAQLKQQMDMDKPLLSPHPWDKVFGSFANSDGFEEAVRLGREYRLSLRAKDNEEAA